jgi:hypothetical protein
VPALEAVMARKNVVPQTGRSVKITRPRPILRAVPATQRLPVSLDVMNWEGGVKFES